MNSTLPVPLPLPLFPLAVSLRRVLHPAFPTFMAGMTCCCTLSSNLPPAYMYLPHRSYSMNHLQLWVARNPHPHPHFDQRCHHHLHQTHLQKCPAVAARFLQVRGYGIVDDASWPAVWPKLPTLINGSGTVPLRHQYVTVPSFPRYGECKNYDLETVHGTPATAAVKMTASGAWR